MSKTPFPPVSQELIDALGKHFPDKIPNNPGNHEPVNILIGQQQVIRFLQHQFNLQNENILENN